MKNIFSMLLLIVGFSLSVATAQQVKTDKSKIIYDFSCMETDGVSGGINIGSDMEKEMLDAFGASVTIHDEKAVGAASLVKKKEGSYNSFSTIFSAHPYSGKRAVCSRNHLYTNYLKNCTH